MAQKILFALILFIVLANSSTAAPDIVKAALHGVAATSVAEMQHRIFNAPVYVYGAEHRQKAVATLPEGVRGGRITEGVFLRRVEKVARPVLRLHKREGEIELFLYRHKTPVAMVWRGYVLAISDSLAAALSDEELAGVVAHELAHAYFMDETVAAKRRGDEQGMKVVELKCDAVAMLTLKLMGTDPVKYVSGLQKLNGITVVKRYNLNSWWHPSISERKKFSRRFVELLKGLGSLPTEVATRAPQINF